VQASLSLGGSLLLLMLAAKSKRFFISIYYQQVIIFCLHFPAELGFIYKEDRKKKG